MLPSLLLLATAHRAGANRTLILVDGMRAPPTNFQGTVDVDVLPQLLIKRVDVVTAGPMGPNAKLFGVGVVAFLAGWGLVKVGSQK